MRSKTYPTQYKIGTLHNLPLYWSPGMGYAVERDGQHLVEVKDISGAKLFTDFADWEHIEHAIRESEGRLRNAMDAALRDEVESIEEDMAWAEQCEREKEATLRQGSGVY